MALGFQVLRNETLKLLNETNTSVIGELSTGTGQTLISATVALGNPSITANNNFAAGDQIKFLTSSVTNIVAGAIYTVSATGLTSTTFQLTSITPTGGTAGTFTVQSTTVFSDSTICDYLNEAAREMARTCAMSEGAYTISNTSNRINDLAFTSVWYAKDVYIGTTRLTHCGENELRNYDLSYIATSGTPTYWYRVGTHNIGLYPVPSSSVDVTVTGCLLPTSITVSSETFSFISDDLLLKALPAYAASKLAMKNYDDPSLVGRSFWMDVYNSVRMQLWSDLDPSARNTGSPYEIPPVQPTK